MKRLDEEAVNKVNELINKIELLIVQNKTTPSIIESAQESLNSLADKISEPHYKFFELQAIIFYAKNDKIRSLEFIQDAVSLQPDLTVYSRTGALLAELTIQSERLEKSDGGTKDVSLHIPQYYTVSTMRLVLLSLLTLSLYIVYWSYKNWKAIKVVNINKVNKNGNNIKVYPKLNSFFFPIASYELFCSVRDSAKELKVDKPIAAGRYAWLVFFLNLLSLGFIPVITAQKYINRVKKAAFNDEEITKGTTFGEVAFVLLTFGYSVLIIVFYANGGLQSSYISPSAQLQLDKSNSLLAQYNKCSEELLERYPLVNGSLDQQAVDKYNSDYESCEAVRLEQNKAANEYNKMIGL